MTVIVKETRLLRPRDTAAFPVRSTTAYLSESFRGSPKVRTEKSFCDRLDLNTRPSSVSRSDQGYVAVGYLLKLGAYDKEIRGELPEDHLSTPEELTTLIKAQWEGRAGILLVTGHANVFYLLDQYERVFAAAVRRNLGYNKWCITDHELDQGCGWLEGTQILLPGVMGITGS